MLKSDLDYLGLSDIYAVQGFYRMGKENLLNFSKGAEINTDDGAQLEFSAPKSLRRATTELNRKIMVPYIVDSPPWLKNKPLAVPEAMHHYYMAQSYVASVANNRALKELEQAVRLGSNKSEVLRTPNQGSFGSRQECRGAEPHLPPWSARAIRFQRFWP